MYIGFSSFVVFGIQRKDRAPPAVLSPSGTCVALCRSEEEKERRTGKGVKRSEEDFDEEAKSKLHRILASSPSLHLSTLPEMSPPAPTSAYLAQQLALRSAAANSSTFSGSSMMRGAGAKGGFEVRTSPPLRE